MNNNAFTLSEVLITLGIIGVVSAITLPVISGIYKKAITKNQIKQAYSLISNAVNRVAMDDDYPHGCYYGLNGISFNGEDCNDFFDAIISNLETTKVCIEDSFNKGCVPDYITENFPDVQGGCAGFSAPNIKRYSKSLILKNGIIIFSYGGSKKMPIIAFDINGFNGPNKPGYDVYAMRLSAKQHGFPVYGLSNDRIVECMNMSDSTVLFKSLSEVNK